jgi:hypothetical protein
MFRNIFVAVSTVVVAVAVLLPASPAGAATYKGKYSGCYSIKKKGNYNRIRLGSTGVIQGGQAAGYGSLKLTFSCQRLNSVPISNFHIYWVGLRVNGRQVATSTSADAHYRSASLHRETRFVSVSCSKELRVAMRVSYRFYGQNLAVRPFTVVGPIFHRC